MEEQGLLAPIAAEDDQDVRVLRGIVADDDGRVGRPGPRMWRIVSKAAPLLLLCAVAACASLAKRGRAPRQSSAALEQALLELVATRPAAALQAEEKRRSAAQQGDRPLMTADDLEECDSEDRNRTFCDAVDGLFSYADDGFYSWSRLDGLYDGAVKTVFPYFQNRGFSFLFPFMNFVQGFPRPGRGFSFVTWFYNLMGWHNPKWKPPVQGETMGVISYQDYAKQYLDKPYEYDFFGKYYTGSRVPSWEDNTNHKIAVTIFDTGIKHARALGVEPMNFFRPLEPRFAFDQQALVKAGWDHFSYLDATDVKYASNGVWGISVLENLVEKYNSQGGEVLGPLMTDSVFSVHLTFDGLLFHVDMSDLEKYTPIPGYAALGGKAAFREYGGSLNMVSLSYNGTTYTDFTDEQTTEDFESLSKRSGWRFAEAALISSLLSMTNLVLHVKDLHLELAAAFQAVTVDAFAQNTSHPVRKFLDPFILRSVQATNDNFKLLFDYKAAEFSLAPLPVDEQLKLIDDFIREKPLNLADMDMERFGELRNMPKEVSTREAMLNESTWGWRWHYRSLEMQRLYDELIDCRLSQHYADGDAAVDADETLQEWWASMLQHMPALARASEKNPKWAAEKLTFDSLKRVLRVLLVWLSWIHEDVGHSAASYVYNAVHTPMCVPEDGVGVPMFSWVFNAGAYRGFVFLERPALLDEPPSFWFDQEECSGVWWWHKCSTPANDPGLKCLTDFQDGLRRLGDEDSAFSECGKTGFYSCVDRVETAVSS